MASLFDPYTFKTAQEWVSKSSPGASSQWLDAIASICKQRKGVWTVLKNPPKDTTRALVWHAFKIAKHHAVWGDLHAWSERVTILLMRADEDQRKLFEYILDTTTAQIRARNAAQERSK